MILWYIEILNIYILYLKINYKIQLPYQSKKALWCRVSERHLLHSHRPWMETSRHCPIPRIPICRTWETPGHCPNLYAPQSVSRHLFSVIKSELPILLSKCVPSGIAIRGIQDLIARKNTRHMTKYLSISQATNFGLLDKHVCVMCAPFPDPKSDNPWTS